MSRTETVKTMRDMRETSWGQPSKQGTAHKKGEKEGGGGMERVETVSGVICDRIATIYNLQYDQLQAGGAKNILNKEYVQMWSEVSNNLGVLITSLNFSFSRVG